MSDGVFFGWRFVGGLSDAVDDVFFFGAVAVVLSVGAFGYLLVIAFGYYGFRIDGKSPIARSRLFGEVPLRLVHFLTV